MLNQNINILRLAEVTETAEAAVKGGVPAWVFIVCGVVAACAVVAAALIARANGKKPAAARADEASANTGPRPEVNVERETLPIAAVGNVHGIGSRPDQQDAFGVSSIANNKLVKEKGILAIVADGMGGLKNSGEISQTIVRSALKRFSEFSGNQRETLLMLGANINGLANDSFDGGTGTTFIAASIRDDLLDFISIGDSRIALCRGSSLLALNRVHNYAADLDSAAARGQVSVTSAMNDPKRARLTSYVGMNEPKAVDMPAAPIQLSKGDRVIIMTDGVFGTLSDAEIASALEAGAPEAALRLEALIKEKKKENQDNYTAIIIEI